MTFHCVLYFCFIFSPEVFHTVGYFLFDIVNFALNSFISLFMVFSVSLWYLFRAPVSSLICFYVFLYSLFLWSWNFLSASCMFWFTLSCNISMKFSVISCRISSFKMFLWASLVPWDSLPLFCLDLELGIHFLHFPLNPVLIYYWGENGFCPFFIFPFLHLVMFLSLFCMQFSIS
jgi:hypothetical protein